MNDHYQKAVIAKVARGFVPGGYKELKRQFPDKMREMEEALEKNWCQEEIEKYGKRLISGLKKIGYWKESD